MKKNVNLLSLIIVLTILLAETAVAMQSTTETPLQTIGDLSWMWMEREIPLDQPSLWFGATETSWKGSRSTGPQISFLASGNPISVSGRVVSDENSALEALKHYALGQRTTWGNLDRSDFRAVTSRYWRGSWQAILEQTVQGITVYGSRLEGQFDQNGRLSLINARLLPSDEISLSFAQTQESALRRLTNEPSARIDFARKILYPHFQDGSVELRAAWQLRAVTDQRDLRPAGIVDAQSGEILIRYNDVQFDNISGTIHGLVLPAYWNDPPQSWVQRDQWVNISNQGIIYSDTTGYYSMNGLSPGQYPLQGRLQGLWVNVDNDAPNGLDATYNDTATTNIPLNYSWNYNLARKDELNVYYHTNLIHTYITGLDTGYHALDYMMPASVGQQFENAYWDGLGMTFGTGGMNYRNFALFSDVIYHEYTHGITDGIYPDTMLPYTGQPGAMNEGWSDYFACTITDEPYIGEGGLLTNNLPMRILENTLVYPQNWAGEVHADGRIFGGALWDLRQAVGAGTADSIIHFSKYLLAEMWEDYFVDVLTTDDDDGNLANGGPHHPQIYEAFGNHGIGPGATPELSISLGQIYENGQGGSIGNGDGFYDPGEVLSMTFSVQDSRYLYPPPAENVTVNISSDNPDLSFDPLVYNLGQVLPGTTVQAPDSLLITVSPQANLSFSRILFIVSANGGSYQITDSVEIIVGHPEILLVDDDGGGNFQQFLGNGLRSFNQVFSTYNVQTQGSLPQTYLNQFGTTLWLTGNQMTNTLTTGDQTALAQYLDGGHNLILTGQNLVEDIGQTTFFANYLKCSPRVGDVNDYFLDGVAGDPITDSAFVLIVGTPGANNQSSPASMAALPGAFEILHYQTDSLHQAGAVRYDAGTYKVVTYSFGLEAVSGMGGSWPLSQLLANNLAWFGIQSGVEITVAPVSPPIVIPVTGGSFNFNIVVTNHEINPFTGQSWIKVQLPDLSWYPVLGPLTLTFPANQTLSRQRVQQVPAIAPAGLYTYRAWVGQYPTPVDSSSFTFTKNATGHGAFVSEWGCYGEPFPGEVLTEPVMTPSAFSLKGASPNPFNPSTALSFELPTASHVTLKVHDTGGRLIAILVDGWLEPGAHKARFDGRNLASGIYLYTLTAGRNQATGKMVLLK